MTKRNGGYIGLLLLMIGVALIVTFIVRTDLFGGDKSVLENGRDSIDEANQVKMKLENGYKFDPDGQEKMIDETN